MTRLLLSLLFATLIFDGTHELIAGPLSRVRSRRHQRAERSHPGNTCQDCIANTKEGRNPAEMSAKNDTPPPGFVALFNGTDLRGWYGWGTQDPDDFRNMSHEAQLEYKKKSIHGGLLNKKGIDVGDHINAHWRVEDGELVNDGKGLYLTTDDEFSDFELLVDFKMQPLGCLLYTSPSPRD